MTMRSITITGVIRAVPWVALWLGQLGIGHAALGGLPEPFNTAGMVVVSSTSSTTTRYTLRDTTLNTGTHVREYIAAGGTVFAVVWEGPLLPDLKVLLGKHFDTLVTESLKAPKAGRAPLAVNRPEVVIYSAGRMRAFEGSAWIPAQLPAGFSADEIR